MATFTKTIPDELVPEVISAYCYNFNYQDFIPDNSGNLIPNPETKANFAKRMDRKFTIDIVKKYRIDALEVQRQETESQADIDCENIDVT